MSMNMLHRLRHSLLGGCRQRRELRARVRASAMGCSSAYQQVVQQYLDLVIEYLVFSGIWDRRILLQEAERVFLRLWSQITVAQRVSDVERLLWLQLTHMEGRDNSPPVLPGKVTPPYWWPLVASLHPRERFLLVARELEGWSPYWLSLATRIRTPELLESLYQLRLELVADQLPNGSGAEGTERGRRCFSRHIDAPRLGQACRNLDRMVASQPEVKAFKNAWLERRCELIELRQSLRLTHHGRRQFLHQLTTRAATRERMRPALKARLINSLHFSAIPGPDRV